MCGGLTVFSPLLLNGVRPVDRVGVVGVGGIGHLAIQLARAWGCDVTALTSQSDKCAEAMELGAHQAVVHTNVERLRALRHHFDLLLVTARFAVNWDALIDCVAPDGRLHVVGVSSEPLPIQIRPQLIMQRRAISGSSTGSPALLRILLDFAARHQILPRTEHFPMSEVNRAVQRLRSGQARYRVVLDADF
jgi:uncharacterized zinc-type alcohol dehydrogenase-like protein